MSLRSSFRNITPIGKKLSLGSCLSHMPLQKLPRRSFSFGPTDRDFKMIFGMTILTGAGIGAGGVVAFNYLTKPKEKVSPSSPEK